MWKMLRVGVVLVLFLVFAGTLQAADLRQPIQRGISWLISRQDLSSGAYAASLPQPAATALVELAILDSPLRFMGPFVTNGFEHIDTHIQSKGGLYRKGKGKFSYNTSLALLAYLARKDEGLKNKVDNAGTYLINMQLTENDGPITGEDFVFGGWGYNHRTLAPNPDVITTFWAVWALKRAGAEEGSEIWKRTVTFLSRCMSEEGGFLTSPGYSIACVEDKTGRRGPPAYKPYGSATCASVAALLLCGVPRTDPGVKSGLEWIGKNFTLLENPGLGKEDLFQYYFLLARALQLAGDAVITGKGDRKHEWAAELSKHLVSVQQSDGRWINENAIKKVKKEFTSEAEPVLTSAYALLALTICHDAAKPKK